MEKKETVTFIDFNLNQIIFFTLTLLLIAFSSFAQNQLSLKVVDENKQPVEYANFRLFTPEDSSVIKGEYANEEGEITIENIPKGSYYGIISFFGFENYILKNLDFSNNDEEIDLGKIYLKAMKSQEFDEVVVKGRETKMMETSFDKRTYTVDKDMTSIGGDVTDVLNNIPSVEVDDEGNITLRGNGSVTVLIDGRESVLSSGEGALNGIPASSVERIEIVTNPSAKYNPEGTAGLINIILKKKKLRGFNSNVQLTAASHNLYNGSLGFNLRKENVNFYANYSFRYQERATNSLKERTSVYGDTLEFLYQDQTGEDTDISHTGNLGLDYFFKENQVFGFGISGTYTDLLGIGNQHNELSYNNIVNSYWDRESNRPRNRRSLDINADYKLDFEDGKGNFAFAITESFGNRDRIGEFEEYYFFPDGTPQNNNYRFQSQERDRYNNKFTANADLVRYISENLKFETGLEAKINHLTETNFLTYYDTVFGEMLPDTNFNDELIYNENIYSTYGIFGHKVTDWFKYQVGLRLEQAFIEPLFTETNTDLSHDYFSLYPSAHLVFGKEDEGNFFTSYSRRVNRPNMRHLNPFPRYDDPLNIRVGNPGLRPEYINSYELGYEKGWGKLNLISSLYFKQTVDKIQRITQFQDDGVNVSTFANIDESYDYGVELIGNYSPFSWWRNMISANVYESRVSANIEGTILSNKGISWNAKFNTTFSLFKNTTNIQINGQYVAPRYTVQGVFQYNPGIDVGITRSFLDKKMIIGLKVSDIFDQRGFYIEVNNKGIEQKSSFKRTSRRLYLTFSYNFGNLKVKEDTKRPELMERGGEGME